MPLPGNVTLVTVTGTYMDLGGNPKVGKVLFSADGALVDPSAKVIITSGTVEAELVNGSFTIQLPATDDSDVTPSGFTYKVTEQFQDGGGRAPFNLPLPSSTTTPVDLSTIDLGQPPSGGTTEYATQVALQAEVSDRTNGDEEILNQKGVSGGIATLDEDGHLVLAQFPDLSSTYVLKTGGTLTGPLTAVSFNTNSAVRSAFFKTTSTTEHAVTIYQAGTSGVDVAAALNVISDNPQTSAMYLSGKEVNRGTLKIAHLGQTDGSDSGAAAISVDLQTVGASTGTAAQGLYIWSSTGPTSGNLITLRMNSRDDFVVKGSGAVGIRVPTGHIPAGALEISQGDDATVGLAITANSGSAQQIVLLKDSGGNSRFEVNAAGNSVHRATAFFTGAIQGGSTTADLGGSSGFAIGMKNATTAPSTNPTGGLILYAGSGVLKYRDPSGNIVSIDGTAVATTDVRPSRQNLIGWSLDPGAAVNNSAVTAGQEILVRLVAESSGTVTHVTFGLGNSPAGCANTYAGIRDSSGVLLASSADVSSSINGASAGKLTITLSASVAVTRGVVYYASFLVGSGTTLPTLSRGASNSVVNDGLSTGAYRAMTAGTGLTSLPSTVTMSSAGQSSIAFYASMAS